MQILSFFLVEKKQKESDITRKQTNNSLHSHI